MSATLTTAGPEEVTFGVALYTGQQPAGDDGPLYRDAAWLARASEDAGFDTFWVSEHHGFADSYLPSPLVLLGALANATSSITLGVGIALGALVQPLRLAEEACVVDHLSDGRLLLGLGVGYLDHELAMFGVDRARRGRRLSEVIEILRLCWQGERFSFQGEFFSFDEVLVTPAPRRPGGIPIWLGGYAAGALRRAARLGDGHLVGRGDPEILERSSRLLADELGVRAREFTFATNLVVVLSDGRGHPDQALRAFEAQQRTYERVQRGTDVYVDQIRVASKPGELYLGSIERYVHVAGTTEQITEKVLEVLGPLGSFGRVHIAMRLLFPEVDRDAQVERIAAIGAEVLPGLRNAVAARVSS